MCSLTKLCLPLMTPWIAAYQAPLSMGLSWQEYWSGSPNPPPGDLPDPGIEPASPVAPASTGGFFTTDYLGSPLRCKEVAKGDTAGRGGKSQTRQGTLESEL